MFSPWLSASAATRESVFLFDVPLTPFLQQHLLLSLPHPRVSMPHLRAKPGASSSSCLKTAVDIGKDSKPLPPLVRYVSQERRERWKTNNKIYA